MQALTPILPNLERFARALVRRRANAVETTEAARDLVAETIAQGFESFDTVRRPEALLSFCFTIATRLYGREQEKSRRFTTFDAVSHEGESNNDEPSNDTDVSLLYAALDTLPEKQREAVIMFEILGFSMKEIHEVQGGTLIAVKVRISRGRDALKKLLCEPQPQCMEEFVSDSKMPGGSMIVPNRTKEGFSPRNYHSTAIV